MQVKFVLPGLILAAMLAGCTLDPANSGVSDPAPAGETALVLSVIDGDTINVRLNGVEQRVRYLSVNTPERDEPCYSEARSANIGMVQGQTVTLVRDQSDTDRYGRLLRFVYVGGESVNERLLREGWAEAVEYTPDTGRTAAYRALEQAAAAAGLGCHPTGIFDDGSLTR